jgi:hypothetical protein
MATITAANSVIIISALGLLAPTQIQGFAPDSLITVDPVDNAETQMGVDGIFSVGWVPMPVRTKIMLAANSPSIVFFETLYASEQQIRDKYQLAATLAFPNIQRLYIGTVGYMRDYSPFAPAQKVLEPREFAIDWGSMTPTPF